MLLCGCACFLGRQHEGAALYAARLQAFTAAKAKVSRFGCVCCFLPAIAMFNRHAVLTTNAAQDKAHTTQTQVQAHNAAVAAGGPGAPTHTLGLNRFADWTREEFERIMLPNKGRGEREVCCLC